MKNYRDKCPSLGTSLFKKYGISYFFFSNLYFQASIQVYNGVGLLKPDNPAVALDPDFDFLFLPD